MSTHGHAEGRKVSLKARLAEEMRRFTIMFVYLWILFGLFVLNERIILKHEGIGFSSQGFAVINALVLAKVMLIAEDLNLGHWLDKRPLIYPILYDSLVFSLLFIVFHVLEKMIIGGFAGKSIASSVPAIGGGGLGGLTCVAVILFIVLIPFFAFRNIDRALGAGRLYAVLFQSECDISNETASLTSAAPAQETTINEVERR